MAKRNFFYKRNWRSKNVRKNCFWTEVNGNKYLVSYQTVVAMIDSDGVIHKFWNDYSVTTMNQINQFASLFNARGFNKKEWLEYPTETLNGDDYRVIKPLIPEIEYSMYDFVEKISYAK